MVIYLKNDVSKHAYRLGLFVILLTITVLGISYAWLNLSLTTSKTNVITAGVLDISLVDGDSVGISEISALPISDEVGMTLTPYTFILENNGNIASEYTIYLDDKALLANEIKMPDTMLKYNITKDGVNVNTALLNESGSFPNRILDSGTISAGEEYTYNLRLWIDEDATNEIMNTTYRGMIRVEASQVIKKLP